MGRGMAGQPAGFELGEGDLVARFFSIAIMNLGELAP